MTEQRVEAERLVRYNPLRASIGGVYPTTMTDVKVTIEGTTLTGERGVIVLHDLDPYRLETVTVIPDVRRSPDLQLQPPDEVETYHFILVGECRQEHSPALSFYTGDAYDQETAQ